MKKLIALISMMALSTLLSFAEDKKEMESIYLKDGSIIRGEIVEYIPNQHVTVKMGNGNQVQFQYDEIDRIEKRAPELSEERYDPRRDRRAGRRRRADTTEFLLKKGFCGFFNGAITAGDQFGQKITLAFGGRLQPNFFLGAGAGITTTDDTNGYGNHISVPLFLDTRFDLLKKKVSPFIEGRVGTEIAIQGITGFYGAAFLGCRFRRFQLSTGFEITPGLEEDYYYEYGEFFDNDHDYHAKNFVINLGFEF
ncbi:MAG: hypothetical protein J6Y37_06195 [Paludibacteraceae bacterium]|nr:hypothetical protein [Paludibacteraceae bacterium]